MFPLLTVAYKLLDVSLEKKKVQLVSRVFLRHTDVITEDSGSGGARGCRYFSVSPGLVFPP